MLLQTWMVMLVAETRKLAVVMGFTFVFSLENHNLFRKLKHFFWGGAVLCKTRFV